MSDALRGAEQHRQSMGLEEELRKARSEAADWEHRCRQQDRELAEVRQRLADSERRRRALEEEVEGNLVLVSELQEAQEVRGGAIRSPSAAGPAAADAALQRRVAEAEGALAAARQDAARAAQQAEESRRVLELRAAKLADALTENAPRWERAQREAGEQHRRAEEQEAAAAAAQRELLAERRRAQELAQRAEGLAAEVSSLTAERDALRGALAVPAATGAAGAEQQLRIAAEQRCGVLEGQTAELRKQAAELSRQLAEAEQQRAELQQRVSRQDTVVEDLQAERELDANAIANLSAALEEKSATIEDQERAVEAQRRRADQQQSAAAAAEQERDALNRELEDAREQLSTQQQAGRRRAERLLSEIESLRRENQVLRDAPTSPSTASNNMQEVSNFSGNLGANGGPHEAARELERLRAQIERLMLRVGAGLKQVSELESRGRSGRRSPEPDLAATREHLRALRRELADKGRAAAGLAADLGSSGGVRILRTASNSTALSHSDSHAPPRSRESQGAAQRQQSPAMQRRGSGTPTGSRTARGPAVSSPHARIREEAGRVPSIARPAPAVVPLSRPSGQPAAAPAGPPPQQRLSPRPQVPGSRGPRGPSPHAAASRPQAPRQPRPRVLIRSREVGGGRPSCGDSGAPAVGGPRLMPTTSNMTTGSGPQQSRLPSPSPALRRSAQR
eukprot:TRINITY_DN11232_c1_g1_i1.p1 TRINITY_DN11232_c1_g1~~TRINITY_DN11232_c1_g1_i1.p1  ORF type:complete len:682 (+),score=194.09 TRINITY_DN11232_c1_g1_i1:111-2156(+)